MEKQGWDQGSIHAGRETRPIFFTHACTARARRGAWTVPRYCSSSSGIIFFLSFFFPVFSARLCLFIAIFGPDFLLFFTQVKKESCRPHEKLHIGAKKSRFHWIYEIKNASKVAKKMSFFHFWKIRIFAKTSWINQHLIDGKSWIKFINMTKYKISKKSRINHYHHKFFLSPFSTSEAPINNPLPLPFKPSMKNTRKSILKKLSCRSL